LLLRARYFNLKEVGIGSLPAILAASFTLICL